MPISIKTVRAFTDGLPWAEIVKNTENMTQGQRLYPSQSHNQKKNFRFNNGATLSKHQPEIILQANKECKRLKR
jgi:hypothetical protein